MTHEKLPAVSPDTIPELAARGPQPAWTVRIHEVLIAAVVIGVSTMLLTSCAAFRTASNVLGDLATGAGELAAIGWVAAVHPSTNEQHVVALAIGDAVEAIGATTNLSTFVAFVGPLAAAAVNADPRIPPADKPAVTAVLGVLLADVDLYAAHHGALLGDLAARAQLGTDFLSGAAGALGGGQ